MAEITANIVNNLGADNKLYITANYWNGTTCGEKNKKAIAPYANIPGLPNMNVPIAVQNAMTVNGSTLIGNGQAIIMPPDVCFSFQYSYLCSLGFGIKATLLPANKVIEDNIFMCYGEDVSSSPKYRYGSLARWKNGNAITVKDAQFAAAGTNLTPEQKKYFKNSYQIRFEAWPLTSYSKGGKTYSIPRGGRSADATGDPDPEKTKFNTHQGTVGEGDPTNIVYGAIGDIVQNRDEATTIVFNILVLNEKYYKKQFTEFFTNPSLGD